MWYKVYQQQYLWDDDPRLSSPSVTERGEWEISGDIKEDIEECRNFDELSYVLSQYGLSHKDFEEIKFPRADSVYLFRDPQSGITLLSEFSFPYPDVTTPEGFLEELDDFHLFNYIEYTDFSKNFWEGVHSGKKLYHATDSSKLNDIMASGLEPRSETRGLRNREMGPAVFTAANPEQLGSHGDTVLSIDVGKMKEDGYMPEVSQEEPIEVQEAYGILAGKLGLRDYEGHYDSSDDYFEDTIAFYGFIPSKYLDLYPG